MPNGTFVEAFSPTRDPIFWSLLANRPALVNGAPGFVVARAGRAVSVAGFVVAVNALQLA